MGEPVKQIDLLAQSCLLADQVFMCVNQGNVFNFRAEALVELSRLHIYLHRHWTFQRLPSSNIAR